jgi:hypothetical protein
MSVSHWFTGINPATVGPYEVKVGDENDPLSRPFWQHWNGEFWGHRKGTPDEAEKMGEWKSSEQSPTWRGCTTPRQCDGPVAPIPPAPKPAIDPTDWDLLA